MNNSEKLTEEIERVLQSGGGSALFDREIQEQDVNGDNYLKIFHHGKPCIVVIRA